MPLLRYSLGLLGALVFFWALRMIQVQGPVPVRLDWRNYLWSLGETFQFLGDPTHLILWMGGYLAAQRIWLVILGIILGIYLFRIPQQIRLNAALLLVAALIAAAPGFTLPRSNLLLLPISFSGFFMAVVLVEFSRRSRFRSAFAMLLVFLFFIPAAKNR